MNALIRTQNGFYCSTVFAYYAKGWKSSVVVFDESNSQLMSINCSNINFHIGITLNVFFADNSQDNWVENGKWHGLGFIVNDKALLKNIKNGHDINPNILDKCKSLQTTETFCGWNKLNTDSDIEKLMNISTDFHDGFIESIEHKGNDINVKFKCWSCRITIKFINIIGYDVGEKISWDNNCIIEAAMRFENGKIKWFVDDFNFAEYENQECYFIAESAQYKIELT